MSRFPLPQNTHAQNQQAQKNQAKNRSARKSRPRHNLVEIATRLAGQHELWEPLVRYDPISRYYARLANENEPVLRTHDRYGNRIDEVEFHPSWHWLMAESVRAGRPVRIAEVGK